MPGITTLRKLQLGAEATPGTAVPATTIWRGMGALMPMDVVEFKDENQGFVVPYDRTAATKVMAQIAMAETEADFTQICHIFDAGVKTVSGVKDGTGSDYIYTYNFGTTAVNTIKTYTIEGGDDNQAQEVEYCFVTDFSITGAVDETVKLASANWLGRQRTDTTYTPALTVPTAESFDFNSGALAIDNSGGTHGTTAKSGTLVSMALNVTTGWNVYKAQDGTLYFTAHALKAKPSVTLDLTMEHDSTCHTEYGNWLSETVRLLQLKFEGSDVATPGTVYSKLTFIINLTGKWESWGQLEDRDGDSVRTGTFRAVYNATDAHFAELIVVNELSALP